MASRKRGTSQKAVKADSYASVFLGENTPAFGVISSLGEFYVDNPMARRIVDVIPEEIVTPGFNLDGIADEKAFKSMWDEKALDQKIIEAMCWSRLHGGAAIIALAKDNRALTSPLSKGAQLESIRVHDRHSVSVATREENPRNPRFGEPKIYNIKPQHGLDYKVHYSRVHVIDGERAPDDKRRQNGGWGESVLSKKLIEAIQDHDYCQELATQLLKRKQQAVWKVRNLADLCDDDDGRSATRIRLAQVDNNSGVGRAIGIDALEEEYEVLNSDISGVDAFLDKKMDRIVSLSGIHEIILKNKNVGGVSSSQNTALETFYKLIERRRKEIYKPLLEWLLPMLVQQEEWSIRFEPLSVPTEKDLAEIFSKYADSVVKLGGEQYIDVTEARDTMQAISDVLKLKAGTVTLPPRENDEVDNESSGED